MLYDVVALVTAGVALAMGSISILVGKNTKDKSDLIFGFIGFTLFVFFVLPPHGFILNDHAPYPTDLLVKRIFIFTYYGTLPWFVAFFTGHRKKLIPGIISIYIAFCYIVMFMEAEDNAHPLWARFAIGGFGANLVYGLWRTVTQYKVEPKKARWLGAAFSFYGILFLLTAINQIGNNIIADAINMKLFFPMHFHVVLFMLIMGLRTVGNVFDTNRLKQMVAARDQRWKSLTTSAAMMVLELDLTGKITYINEYGATLMGYRHVSEIVRQDWFSNFLPGAEAAKMRSLFAKIVHEQRIEPFFRNTILDKYGNNLQVSWVHFLNYSDDGKLLGVIAMGHDFTSEEKANRLVERLKKELEKESIDLSAETQDLLTGEMIGKGKGLMYAIQKAMLVASTSAPVLIEGETGVGKDLLAEFIYKNSSRNTDAFVKVNCGALPKDLIEDELFGHEKGAFTSAIQMRKGRFELADGGTIFLDEIGELPLEMQPKLLRVLQNGEFERVGGQKTIKVNVRIIAATNRYLAAEVDHGRFRSDLFYRLNVFPITIPPLRQRRDDLPLLINYFIADNSKKYGKALIDISKLDLQKLLDYSWPGNIRELKNVVERSVISSQGNTLRLDWFLSENLSTETQNSRNSGTLEDVDRDHIIKVMEACHWKINGSEGAAEILKMHPNTLRSKMKKLGISRPQGSGTTNAEDTADSHQFSTYDQT